eukprot:CAMPEP_0185468772 /NCGR_PEP_ID=MMETSP1365-20130426/97898_1 /TAXON_ID=38817 /ORGANISM="Gephyrocapsa oceanica, Strain RCC1303" /LENGTH=181 /DNA_ID=CAMNT_0028075511 /DNA_START=925 /DNA_END=1466 /DNA_ORIENTATION=-
MPSSGPSVAAVREHLDGRTEFWPLGQLEPGTRLEDGASAVKHDEGWHRGNLVELERLNRRLAALKREEPDIAPRRREPSRAWQQRPARGALLAAKEDDGDAALARRGSHRGSQLLGRWQWPHEGRGAVRCCRHQRGGMRRAWLERPLHGEGRGGGEAEEEGEGHHGRAPLPEAGTGANRRA